MNNNPRAPASVRFGMGLCYFRMENYEKARFSFERVIELESDNAIAKVALAIVEI